MTTPDLLSCAQSDNLAAWVQAIGSILAIIAAALVARFQHIKTVELLEFERKRNRLESAKLFIEICRGCKNKLKDIQERIDQKYGDLCPVTDEISHIEISLAELEAFPLENLPYQFVCAAVATKSWLKKLFRILSNAKETPRMEMNELQVKIFTQTRTKFASQINGLTKALNLI
ncbi:hypothetical protein [Nitrogeniibacter aestuarii]|uniref:hypothetical protein n=1 Tax=Nitrogeniibacter aestuarii TaxID=2815343 RepID=UPI001E2A8A18|nr:hypothetical protein [Nitrogeniibacter aestuarii]